MHTRNEHAPVWLAFLAPVCVALVAACYTDDESVVAADATDAEHDGSTAATDAADGSAPPECSPVCRLGYRTDGRCCDDALVEFAERREARVLINCPCYDPSLEPNSRLCSVGGDVDVVCSGSNAWSTSANGDGPSDDDPSCRHLADSIAQSTRFPPEGSEYDAERFQHRLALLNPCPPPREGSQ